MRAALRCVLVAVLCAAPAASRAAEAPEPISADRPDFSESATLVAPRRVQLEAGLGLSGDGETRAWDGGEALVRIGLVPRAELRVGLPSYVSIRAPGGGTASGFEDASLGAKILLAPGDEAWPGGTRLACVAETSLPTGDAGFGAARAEPSLTLAADWDLGARTGLTANLGLTRLAGETRSFASLSAERGTRGAASFFGEFYGMLGQEGGTWTDGGLTWKAGADLQLDAHLGVQLNDKNGWTVGAGVARRW